MTPVLQKITLNGASRHRLSKGFILIADDQQLANEGLRDQIVRSANQAYSRSILSGFSVEERPAHSSVIGIVTPFLPVYTVAQRDAFIDSLLQAVSVLLSITQQHGYRLAAAGVNPFYEDLQSGLPSLCADIHQIEVYDNGEIERIYNLYRQFLPELLAISTHSGVYGGTLQKDFSYRMRLNPASFLPRYLSQFSVQHLERLERMIRKDYGLADLRQMDVNPLGGNPNRLDTSALFEETPAAVELRFVDAQCSYPFIRAQIIIFQAISMYGRALARLGKRLPYLQDEVIDENKALAVQNGAGAILKPDPKFRKDDGGRSYWFHDKGEPERATTALLMTLDRLLLSYLQELECQYEELAPIILGAELRKQGKRCLVNYAEYQKYLYYTAGSEFSMKLKQYVEQLLTARTLDYVSQYNTQTYTDNASEIAQMWTAKLRPQVRSVQFSESAIRQRQGFPGPEEASTSTSSPILTSTPMSDKSIDLSHEGTPQITNVRQNEQQPRSVNATVIRHSGRVKWYNQQNRYGFIRTDVGAEVYVNQSDLEGTDRLEDGQRVTFELSERGGRAAALRVQVEASQRDIGRVSRFDDQQGYGFITTQDGKEVYVHRADIDANQKLFSGDDVTFEILHLERGPRAIYVKLENRLRLQGTIKWFDSGKHFGYITQTDGSDLFVHQSDLDHNALLQPGQLVSYEIGQSPKGLKAIRVRPTD